VEILRDSKIKFRGVIVRLWWVALFGDWDTLQTVTTAPQHVGLDVHNDDVPNEMRTKTMRTLQIIVATILVFSVACAAQAPETISPTKTTTPQSGAAPSVPMDRSWQPIRHLGLEYDLSISTMQGRNYRCRYVEATENSISCYARGLLSHHASYTFSRDEIKSIRVTHDRRNRYICVGTGAVVGAVGLPVYALKDVNNNHGLGTIAVPILAGFIGFGGLIGGSAAGLAVSPATHYIPGTLIYRRSKTAAAGQ
jgi:hypothetical protein